MQEDFRPVVALVAAQTIALSAHYCVLPNTCFGRELNIPIIRELRFLVPYCTYGRTRTLLDCDILISLTWYNFVSGSFSYNSYMPATTYDGHNVHLLNHEKQSLVLTLASFHLAVRNFPCQASSRTAFNNCSSCFDLSSCFAFVAVTSFTYCWFRVAKSLRQSKYNTSGLLNQPLISQRSRALFKLSHHFQARITV